VSCDFYSRSSVNTATSDSLHSCDILSRLHSLGNAQNALHTFTRNFPVDGELPTCCQLGRLGGAAVRRRTRDRKDAGSTPSRGAIKSTKSTLPSIPPG